MHQLTDQPLNPPAYLRTSVANLARSRLRRLRLERRIAPHDHIIVNIPDIDETWEAVCRLPFRQRAVLVLRYYEDLTEADIAQVLDCRLGTVKSTMHRALARLRKELS